jgi:hypothetical protein
VIHPKPIVLIQIDGNSSISILQTDGVHVALLDRRVDPLVTLLPEINQIEVIIEALGDLKVVSAEADDLIGSAVATIRRIRSGFVIVSNVPQIIKIGETV